MEYPKPSSNFPYVLSISTHPRYTVYLLRCTVYPLKYPEHLTYLLKCSKCTARSYSLAKSFRHFAKMSSICVGVGRCLADNTPNIIFYPNLHLVQMQTSQVIIIRDINNSLMSQVLHFRCRSEF